MKRELVCFPASLRLWQTDRGMTGHETAEG